MMPDLSGNYKPRGDTDAVRNAHAEGRRNGKIGRQADGKFIKGNNLGNVWRPGQSGNPIGRVKEKLSQKFIKALAQDFDKHGQSAVERAREENPVAYLALVIKAVPPETQARDKQDVLTPAQCKEELAQLLDELGYERKVAGEIVSDQ